MILTGRCVLAEGVPLFIPNDTVEGKDFYISYNSYRNDYGCDTTALVIERKDVVKFLILNGFHMKEYQEIINNGGDFQDCLEYYVAHINQKNKLGEDYKKRIIFNKGKIEIIDENDLTLLPRIKS